MTQRIAVREITTEEQENNTVSFPAGVVAPGRKVTLNFSLALENNQQISSNFGASPVSCVMGDGSLLPGFEKVLYGMGAGEQCEVQLSSQEAFGDWNPDNVQQLPRFRFPPDLVLEKGLMIDFAGAGSYNQAGVVTQFDSANVTVDFNHPLSGRSINFVAHIHRIEEQAD